MIRRLEMLKPSPSATTPSPVAHRFEIIKRFAHAHHDDVGDKPLARVVAIAARRPIVQPVARQHHLAGDLGGGEIADKPLRAGVAESAIERATDLAGDAQRAAVGFRNVDAFDLMRRAVDVARKPQKPFARAVDRNLLVNDFGPRQRKALRQCRAHLLRQRGHRFEILHAAHIKPVPDLLHAHAALPFRHAGFAQRIGQRIARQPDQRRLCRRGILLKRPLFHKGRGRPGFSRH